MHNVLKKIKHKEHVTDYVIYVTDYHPINFEKYALKMIELSGFDEWMLKNFRDEYIKVFLSI